MSLADRDKKAVWHPYTQMLTAPEPLAIARAEGVWLYTDDGRKIMDGLSSWWVNIHGHSHPKLNAALAAQARELEHVLFAGCTHRPAVELAERLLALLPAGMSRVFYSDNGSTAVEAAMKMAIQYWRNRGEPERRTFVTLHHAYHGDTVGAMSAGEDSIFTQAFAPMLFPVVRAHAPYCYRCPVGLNRATCRIQCLNDLERKLRESGDSIAGVLIEPMLQAAGGMIVWPKEFLAGAQRLCAQVRNAADRRRGSDRLRTHGEDVRMRTRRSPSRHHLFVQGTDRRVSAAGRNRRHRGDFRRLPERGSQPDVLSRAFLYRQSVGVRGGAGQSGSLRGRTHAQSASPGWNASCAKGWSLCADCPTWAMCA